MSLLSKVSKGIIKKPHLVLIAGVDGVGKSSFAAQAPNPIFIGSEDGTNNLDVTRFPSMSKWSDVELALNELLTTDHEYKTLVVDSLDWLEPVLYQHICDKYNVKSIELAAGGYGKGYVESLNEWIKFNKILMRLREEKLMNIILIGHTEIVKFSDPTNQSDYDRFQLKLYKKSAALFREFVDSVLFANFETFAKKDGNKTRAYGDGVRVMFTERRPGFDAKNRFGLPFQMSLSWEEYVKGTENDRSKLPDYLRESIMELAKELNDERRAKALDATEKAGNNIVQLEAIKNRVVTLLNEES
jgi:hypothetical protein